MGQTMRFLGTVAMGAMLLAGSIGCTGHRAATAVGQESAQGQVELPELVVEEHVQPERVVPSSVPPATDALTQGAVVDPPPEPEVEATMEASDAPAASPPPRVTEREMLPLVAEASPSNVFLLDIPFNFDQHSLREDALAFVEVNATRIKDEGVGTIVLEGRGDEVGTANYNLVLGERRAQAVKRYLLNLGLGPAGLRIVSYGKERPLCMEHSVHCWQMNRSVRFVVE